MIRSTKFISIFCHFRACLAILSAAAACKIVSQKCVCFFFTRKWACECLYVFLYCSRQFLMQAFIYSIFVLLRKMIAPLNTDFCIYFDADLILWLSSSFFSPLFIITNVLLPLLNALFYPIIKTVIYYDMKTNLLTKIKRRCPPHICIYFITLHCSA